MSENNEKNIKKAEKSHDASEEKKEELTVDQKLKEAENKLLRSLAEIENQRRRFEKKLKMLLNLDLLILQKKAWLFLIIWTEQRMLLKMMKF